MNREPAAVGTAVAAVMSAGVKLLVIMELVDWTDIQTASIMLFTDALLSLGALLYIRARVTPVNAPVLPLGTTVTTPPETGDVDPTPGVVTRA